MAKDVAGSQSLSGRIARAYASAVAKEKYHVTLTPVQWGQISIALMEQDFAIRETLADLQNPQFSSIDLNANAIRTYRSILTANDNDFGWSERACGIFGGVDAGGAA